MDDKREQMELTRQLASAVINSCRISCTAADDEQGLPAELAGTQGHVDRPLFTLETASSRDLVASVVRRMNEVTLRRARLVLGWVTVVGRVYHHGM